MVSNLKIGMTAHNSTPNFGKQLRTAPSCWSVFWCGLFTSDSFKGLVMKTNLLYPGMFLQEEEEEENMLIETFGGLLLIWRVLQRKRFGNCKLTRTLAEPSIFSCETQNRDTEMKVSCTFSHFPYWSADEVHLNSLIKYYYVKYGHEWCRKRRVTNGGRSKAISGIKGHMLHSLSVQVTGSL